MYRSIIYSQEQIRSFDFLEGMRDCMKSEGNLAQSLFGPSDTILTRFSAAAKSIPNMTFDLASGSILEWAPVDADPYGAAAADASYCYQLGFAEAQEIVLTTAQLSSGQSQWVLIRARFKQVDAVRPGDPTSGVQPFYNSADPRNPLQGINNNGGILPSVRKGSVEISTVYGTPATTGAQVAPSPGGGFVPLYLVLLTFGQTTITNGQILEAPAGIGGYPPAPIWRGVRAQHHKGAAYGQAPQIDVTTEITGIVPLSHLPATSLYGLLPTLRSGVGTPVAVLAGGAGDLFFQSDASILWVCVTTGGAGVAVWQPIGLVGGCVVVSSFPISPVVGGTIYLCNTASGAGTCTLGTAASYGTGVVEFKNIGSTNVMTIYPATGESLGGMAANAPITLNPGDAVRLGPQAAVGWHVLP